MAVKRVALESFINPNPCNEAAQAENARNIYNLFKKLDQLINIYYDETNNEYIFDITNVRNINIENNLIVQNDVTINNDLTVLNSVNITNNLIVQNDVTINNILTVDVDIVINGPAWTYEDILTDVYYTAGDSYIKGTTGSYLVRREDATSDATQNLIEVTDCGGGGS